MLSVAIAANTSNSTPSATPKANVSANATVKANASNVTATPTPTPTPSPTPAIIVEQRYYVSATETPDNRQFTHKKNVYYIITANGQAIVLLDANYDLVANNATIDAATASYAEKAEVPFKQADLDALNKNLVDFEVSFNLCRYDKSPGAYYNFSRGIGSTCFQLDAKVAQNLKSCWIIYEFDLTSYTNYGKTISAQKTNMKNGTNAINESLPTVTQSITDIATSLAAKNYLALQNNLSTGAAAFAKIKAGVDQFNSGHNVMRAIVPWGTVGGLNTCTLNAAAVSGLESSFALSGSFANATAIAQRIKTETPLRRDQAAIRRVVEPVPKLLDDYAKGASSLNEKAVTQLKANASFTASAFAELQTLSAKVQSAPSVTQAKTAAEAFNAKYNSSYGTLSNALNVLPTMVGAVAQLNNATASVAAAAKIYGTGDSRVTAMQKEQAELKKSLELKQADLVAGRAVTLQEAESIRANATTLAFKAQNLQRSENQIDFVLVGGLVLIVVLIAAAFLFLRSYRVSLKQGGSNVKEVKMEDIKKK